MATRNEMARHLREHGVILPPSAPLERMDREHQNLHAEIRAERELVTGMCAADEHATDHPLCNVCRPEAGSTSVATLAALLLALVPVSLVVVFVASLAGAVAGVA